MRTAGSLGDRSKKDLADLARRRGVRGWESMTKDDLIRAINRAAARSKPARDSKKPAAKPARKPAPKPAARTPARPAAKSAAKFTKPLKPAKIETTRPLSAKPGVNGTHRTKPESKTPSAPAAKAPPAKPAAKPAAAAKPALPTPAPSVIPADKDLSAGKGAAGPVKDRIFLMVPDPFWLHATWELTHQSVQRAEAALKQDWHGAKPVIRLFDVTSQDTTSTSETPVRDIVIHGGCNNWYIDVPQPPRSYRADIGYVSRRGEFFVLARSNVATPPKAGSTEALDMGWSEMDPKKAERIMAMSSGFESSAHPELRELFEERLRRPMGAPKETGFGTGAALPGSLKKFHFDIDAELIVYGKTEPTAHVTLQNEPVKLRPDGTFTMLFSLPDSRQIIPAVATSADGVEERTIVLAVERNTKHLDPMIHDQMNEG
jgi:hypothetical protein